MYNTVTKYNFHKEKTVKRTKFLIIAVAIIVAVTSVFGLGACNTIVNFGASNDVGKVFAKYTDISKWNFADNLTVSYNGESSADYYEYSGYNILNSYEYNGVEYTDYLGYDASGKYCFYYDNGNGTYATYDEDSDDFAECYSYLCIIDLSQIGNFAFTKTGALYTADNPGEAGNAVLGEYTDYTWSSMTVTIASGRITEIVGVMNDGYTYRHELSKYGSVHFSLPNGGTTPVEPTGTMEKQTYNAATFDDERLQDKMGKDDADGAIGLPSKGTYNALVIPVRFQNDTITQEQLTKLNLAFNGTSEQTGWESVKTYYKKASYNTLDLTFDIQSVFDASRTADYYQNYKEEYVENGQTYTRTGDEIILTEALAYYENKLDLTKYDTNDDGCIDAVYLIYSAPVDYDNADFYWAYVTWYYGANRYDGLDAFYYMFTGFDFMNEDLDAFDGMQINAETYIHETGHLLGLDDYYDYDASSGSNEGLGGADMMDYNKGDHGVYSKTMLGWLTPAIVTATQTITIQSSQAKGDAILVPLNFNNSYFCEYLLIDLYSAKGLNELASKMDNTILYGGASYGVRIYHVSSWIDNPYSDTDYGSFTNYNNSTSSVALIKLIEADGYTKFSDTRGNASKTDLWQAGQSLSTVFPQYTTNDGKLLIFDITINSVSESEATITITYNS